MKRKKWSEVEEQTLLTKYADLFTSGTLSKLKTREKKFRPIADHVNAVHHLQDPIRFPFKWSWRDVSIKVQNMRHQYLGVKQKIRVSTDEFNWKDGENHWENFLKYKEVFGDVELEVRSKKVSSESDLLFKDCGDLGLGIDSEDLEEEEEDDGDDEEGNNGCVGADDENGNANGGGEEEGDFGVEKRHGEMGINRKAKMKKGFGGNGRLRLLGAQVMELRDAVARREEKRKEREFSGDKAVLDREEKMRELEIRRELRQDEKEERMQDWEMELEQRELMWSKLEVERSVRLEVELDEERRKRRMLEERREEEEMEWRERMVGMQMEHEKAMMQMHADACQNQIQILGVMARLICQFFGSASDGLGSGLGGLTPQVLQNLQHPGGLGDNVKPDANSPSEFM